MIRIVLVLIACSAAAEKRSNLRILEDGWGRQVLDEEDQEFWLRELTGGSLSLSLPLDCTESSICAGPDEPGDIEIDLEGRTVEELGAAEDICSRTLSGSDKIYRLTTDVECDETTGTVVTQGAVLDCQGNTIKGLRTNRGLVLENDGTGLNCVLDNYSVSMFEGNNLLKDSTSVNVDLGAHIFTQVFESDTINQVSGCLVEVTTAFSAIQWNDDAGTLQVVASTLTGAGTGKVGFRGLSYDGAVDSPTSDGMAFISCSKIDSFENGVSLISPAQGAKVTMEDTDITGSTGDGISSPFSNGIALSMERVRSCNNAGFDIVARNVDSQVCVTCDSYPSNECDCPCPSEGLTVDDPVCGAK